MGRTKKALIGAGAMVAGVAAAVAMGRAAIRRARTGPDPERGTPLAERPGTERRVVSFDGTGLAVNSTGPSSPDMPTLVFIHGFTLDMTAWHYQWKRFAKKYRCVLYDQRGHGRSDRAAGGDYSMEALGHDLHAVLEAEAPEDPVVLIGHSMGGMSIMSLGATHPEEFGGRVRAVVLANTGAADLVKEALAGLGARLSGLIAPYALRMRVSPDRVYRLRQRAIGGRGDLAFLVARITNFGPKASPSVIDHVVGLAANASPEVWTDLFGSLLEMDLGHALEHIRVPALVLAGDIDRLTPPSSALALKRRLPDARILVFEGTGHCAMLERHADFNRALEGFVEETTDAAETESDGRRRRAARASG